jgi:hypothetical protein
MVKAQKTPALETLNQVVVGSSPTGGTLQALENQGLASFLENTAQGVDPAACTQACTGAKFSDPVLAEIVAAWSTLPDHIRLAVSALVSTAKPPQD